MIARLDQIAPRLKKLLLMLSSERDGEVVNAARLIGSTLQNAGRDWHDLAGVLTDPTAPPRPKREPPRDDRDPDSADWREQRDFCLEHRRLLRGRELEFVTDLGHWHGSLTAKQASWLSDIFRRLWRTTGD
jgi:hypothetical protein